MSLATGLATTGALIWQASSYFFLAMQITFAYGLLSAGWRETLRDLESTVGELEVMNARLRQQVWLRQKSLALELHGSVQSRLTALSKTIEKMDTSDTDKVEKLIADIRQSLSRVEERDYLDGKSFEDLAGDLQLLWEGSVELDLKHSRASAKLLAKDEGLARCVFEIFREAITNSVKHGSASEVVLKSEATASGIAIEIWNNGTPLSENTQYAGSQLLGQLCSRYALRNVKNGVVLSAEVTSTLESAT